PKINYYDAQLYKENWAALDVPRHLYQFTSETMEKFASVNKLKIRTIKPMVFDSFYVSMLSESYINSKNKIINSLKNGFQSNKLAKKENNYSSLLFVLRSEEHTSELQSRENLVCRLLLEKKNHT